MKKKIVILFSCLVVIFFSIFIYSYYFCEKVDIKLIGEEKVVLKLDEKYKELGATAQVCSRNDCEDLSYLVKSNDSVDTSNIGKYNIEYVVNFDNKKYVIERNVIVVDTESPVITLEGLDNVNVCPSVDYKEEGYKAVDNYDGDITDKVSVERKDNFIKYSVKDSSNNLTEVVRKINRVDKEKPVIKLKGANKIILAKNQEYQEAGYTVVDNCSNISSSKVEVKSNLDISKEGTYTISYSVVDKNGNVGTANRTVMVRNSVTFNVTNKEDYITNLEKYINEKNYNVSIGYVNLNTGYTYSYRSNVIYYGASLVKTVDALYVYEKMAFDEATRKKVEKAISVSDNAAHYNLVDLIGVENLRSYGRNLGAKNFLTRSNSDYFGNTTVNDQIAIWKYLFNFINTNSKGNELKRYFINSYGNNLLFDGIPTTMHKYGYYDIYFHNVGIVYSDRPYIVVILTKHGSSNYKTVIKDLSKKIYELNQIDY